MIRPAVLKDATAIASLWNPEIRDTLITFNSVEKSPEDIQQMIAEKDLAGHGFLVVASDDELLGFATYGQFRNGIGYRHTAEHTIVLAKAARGQGVGRSLMADLEAHAQKNGVHSLFAGVSAANQAGVEFHRRLGYVEVAVLKEVGRKFEQWLDLVLLQKHL